MAVATLVAVADVELLVQAVRHLQQLMLQAVRLLLLQHAQSVAAAVFLTETLVTMAVAAVDVGSSDAEVLATVAETLVAQAVVQVQLVALTVAVLQLRLA